MAPTAIHSGIMQSHSSTPPDVWIPHCLFATHVPGMQQLSLSQNYPIMSEHNSMCEERQVPYVLCPAKFMQHVMCELLIELNRRMFVRSQSCRELTYQDMDCISIYPR